MKKETFKKALNDYLPILFDRQIASEEDIYKSFDWYSLHINDQRDRNVPVYFYDWVLLAMGENEKAKAFLAYCNELYAKSLDMSDSRTEQAVKEKIWKSVYTPAKNPSYMDSLGELCLISYLKEKSDSDGYRFLGVDFEVGNGKNADIAFEKNNRLFLIEISNLHYQNDIDLIKKMRKRCNKKLSEKTKDRVRVAEWFANKGLYDDVNISIALFVWDETQDIKGASEDIEDLLQQKADDLLPPATLICEIDLEGKYQWSIVPLTYALTRWQRDS